MTLTTHSLSLDMGGTTVLRDASLSFQRGRVTVIIGPNGAGKTSLVRALAGLIPPNKGSIRLDQSPLSANGERAKRIGYLPQNASPSWNVIVRELVALGRIPHRDRLAASTEVDAAAVEAALIATDTRDISERLIGTLSGGERARVMLARVLAGEPDWIIADEPLANLDPPHARDVLSLLQNAASNGKGVILVLHQLSQALRCADDVVIVKDGLIQSAGAADTTLTAEQLRATFGMGFEIVAGQSGPAVLPLATDNDEQQG